MEGAEFEFALMVMVAGGEPLVGVKVVVVVQVGASLPQSSIECGTSYRDSHLMKSTFGQR